MSIFSFLLVIQTGMTMVGLSRTEAQRVKNRGAVVLGALLIAGVLVTLMVHNFQLLSYFTGIYYIFLSLDVLFSARNQPKAYWWLVPIYLMLATCAVLAGTFKLYVILLIGYIAFWVLTYLVSRRVMGN